MDNNFALSGKSELSSLLFLCLVAAFHVVHERVLNPLNEKQISEQYSSYLSSSTVNLASHRLVSESVSICL